MPQLRYRDAKKLRLNRYGGGPFCRFHVPSTFPVPGVYALAVSGEVCYIGECDNLSRRFGPSGYGAIQPRNCFVGGQSTNCKINNLVLRSANAGRITDLWFYQTADRKQVEAKLISQLQPPWNGRTEIGMRPPTHDSAGFSVVERKRKRDNGAKAVTGNLAARIRRHANEAFVEPARKAGKKEVVIGAGDVHKDLRLESRMPAVCGALDAQLFQTQYRVLLSKRTGPPQGATVTWYFSILP
jgi:hypothetical protein